MRTLTIVALACLALSNIGITRADAAPWCADYSDKSTNCGFTSFQQCQADISGVGGFCSPNPAAN